MNSEPVGPPRSILDLALAFSGLALRGFGGVGAQAREVLVVNKRWLNEAEFAEVMGLGQVLPGPNVINVSAMLGDEWFGWRGALAGIAGMVIPSTLLVLLLHTFAVHVANEPHVISAERSVVAAAAGLMIATGIRTAQTYIERGRVRLSSARLGVAALTVVLACTPHIGIPFAVLMTTPIAFALEVYAARNASA